MEDVDEINTGDREGAIFFPTHKNAVSDFTYYYKKFICVQDPIMRI